MPVMHFAFGGLHRAGKNQEQLDMFFEHILRPKQLKSFICPEFVPLLNSPNAKIADPDSAYATSDGGVSFSKWVPSPPVSLLPNDIPMISFVDIPFNKLGTWSPADHYGKLGIAFTNLFKSNNSIQRVYYYALPQLEKDELVIKLDRAIKEQNNELKESLWRKILHYRKPAVLWEEINELFAVLKLSAQPEGINIDKITYSRYEVGYNFECEKESRIVTESEGDLIKFTENEVLAVIVPNEESKNYIEDKLENSWKKIPKILVYPG